MLADLPLLARHGIGGAAAGADLDVVRSADGDAGHGCESGHAAGDCAGVGIVADYALYALEVMLKRLKLGDTEDKAYRRSLQFTERGSC